ncbi:hypothetical protein PHLCEN_2v8043 [Hermanssonia centrifuga]|uniref:Uncharacterized protein n=1 Tax=Hermanssonia centrifuga TaxID=98765 RepID=A0A2R6NUS2_9APHY|nr:hypothetical protein PHLCEN_2v8043 [Hermanssonia centrifuga]
MATTARSPSLVRSIDADKETNVIDENTADATDRGYPGADAATWGVGLDREPSIARLRSVVSAVNKLLGSRRIHA